MRKLKISLCLLQQRGTFLLQLRGNNPVIGGAGLIGAYGGKINKGEDPAAAICRELAEETTLIVTPEKLQRLSRVTVISDYKLETVEVAAEVFSYIVPNKLVVKSREGELVRLTWKKSMANLDKMTTGTRAIFERLAATKAAREY